MSPKYRALKGIINNLLASIFSFIGILKDLERLPVKKFEMDLISGTMNPGINEEKTIKYYRSWLESELKKINVPLDELEKVLVSASVSGGVIRAKGSVVLKSGKEYVSYYGSIKSS